MKIAYFLQLNMGPGTGVYKKILAQASTWQELGHTVGLFVSTKHPDISADLNNRCSNLGIEVYIELQNKSKLPPPFDGRLGALTRLVKRLLLWKPDITYTRQEFYLPPLRRLLKQQKVVIEINTNDLGELKNMSRLFMTFYKSGRGVLLSKAAGLVYVSREISLFPHYAMFKAPHIIIGNGINLFEAQSLPKSDNIKPRLVFMGHAGQIWHGVDKILHLASLRPEWSIDFIGIAKNDIAIPLPNNVRLHGPLAHDVYEHILEQADCAVGTLALHRNNMQEASPLKVREYLAYGLPVIIGYVDTDFPTGADFILRIPNNENNIGNSLQEIDQFVNKWKGKRVPRSAIESLDYVYKEQERLAFFTSILRYSGYSEDFNETLIENSP